VEAGAVAFSVVRTAGPARREQIQQKEGVMRGVVMGLVGVVSLVAVLSGMAVAQGRPPDATLSLSDGSVAVGIGFTWGTGTLGYQDKTYRVKVQGLSVGEVGITQASATGKVFNLAKLEDFSGTYVAAGAGATVGGGAGATVLRNQKGVVIELTGTTQGVSLKLAAEGIQLTLAE
jgi:hypothetical protein